MSINTSPEEFNRKMLGSHRGQSEREMMYGMMGREKPYRSRLSPKETMEAMLGSPEMASEIAQDKASQDKVVAEIFSKRHAKPMSSPLSKLENESNVSSVEKLVMFSEKESLKAIDDESEKQEKTNKRLSNSDLAECLLSSGDWLVDEGEVLMHYESDKGYWRALAKTNDNRELRGAVPKEYAPEINKNTLGELYEWLVIYANPFVPNPKAKHYINLMDVAIDWRDESCVVDRKELHFRTYLRVKSSDLHKESTGSFKKYLKSVFGEDKATRREFKKFIGIVLSEIRDQKQAFIMHGPSNTGKSVLLNLLRKLLGEGLTSSISFSQFSNEFAVARLTGKVLNVSGEVTGTNNKRLDLFKSVTGNDCLTTAFKNQDHYDLHPHCLFVFAANVYPQIADPREVEFFLRRIVFYPFENVVQRQEWIPDLELRLYEDCGAILKVAMDGLRAWEADSCQIKESPAMLERKKDFRREFDSFNMFAEQYISFDSSTKVASHEVASHYKYFCAQNNLVPLADNVWPVLLKQKFSCKEVTLVEYDEVTGQQKRRRGYAGIKLLKTDSNESENYVVDKVFRTKSH